MIPSETDIKLLDKEGWSVDCESPFEISYEEGGETSRANGYAAELILQMLKEEEDGHE